MNHADALPEPVGEDLQHLKRVSRIKHMILEKYFPAWTQILGSRYKQLAYFDCFAGPGAYEHEGQRVSGSPIIAVKCAIEFLQSRPGHKLALYLIEDDRRQVAKLEASLKQVGVIPRNLTANLLCADSREYIPRRLDVLPGLVPAFFGVDPYGHPLPVPVINKILSRNRSEALINLMWFRINADLANPLMESHLDELFGDETWRTQPFLNMHGTEREGAFLRYFQSLLKCAYVLPFKIRFDQEDKRGGDRTKYYLLHASNHVKAVLLMKEVMWPLGDEEGTFAYSGSPQRFLISETPAVNELEEVLVREFPGRMLTFDGIREQTWMLPFVEKHYREAIRRLASSGLARIERITSKKIGIKGLDRIHFK